MKILPVSGVISMFREYTRNRGSLIIVSICLLVALGILYGTGIMPDPFSFPLVAEAADTSTTSYAQMRAKSGSAGATLNLSASRQAGTFSFSTTDPLGNGDDGGLVIKAPNGFWVRQYQYGPTTPIELDWFESVADGAEITQVIIRLRDINNSTKNFFVRVPSVPMKLSIGLVEFSNWNRFYLLESNAAVTLTLPKPTILNLNTLSWKQRVQNGVSVNAWEAVVPGGKPILEVWSSPPKSHNQPATEVFHWGNPIVTAQNDPGTDPAYANLVKDIPTWANSMDARFMRYWSGTEGGATKLVIHATQDPRTEYATLQGTAADISRMLQFSTDVQDVLIGGSKLTLTFIGGHRSDLGVRGDHSTISVYNGKGDCCFGSRLYLIYLTNTSEGAINPAVISANIKDTFEEGLGIEGGWGDQINRFDLTLSGLASNTGMFVSYGVRRLILKNHRIEDPNLNSSVWNGKTGSAAAQDSKYRYADRRNGLSAGYNETDEFDAQSRVGAYGVPKGTAGSATLANALTWRSAGGNVYTASVAAPVLSVWIEGKPTGKLAKASASTLSQNGDWHWSNGTLSLYDSGGSPSRYSRLAAVHNYTYYRVQNKGWSSSGVKLSTGNYGNKIDGISSIGSDKRWVFWEYLAGTWGPNGSPWAEGKHMFHYEATNENPSGQDLLMNANWVSLGNNKWGLDVSSISTVPSKKAYDVLFVNGEAWDAASGRKKSSATEVTTPKSWHSSGTYITMYSTVNPRTYKLVMGAWGTYWNADANILVKNFNAIPGSNEIGPVWENDNGGDYTQRFTWVGHDDGSPAQIDADAVLVLHEFHEVYNWGGGSLRLRSMNNLLANYPSGARYDRPATGNRGERLKLAGRLIVEDKSYNNHFDGVDFSSRNGSSRMVIEVFGSNVDLVLNGVTAPSGSWAWVENPASSNVVINGQKVTQQKHILGTVTQHPFTLVDQGGKQSMSFQTSPQVGDYIFNSRLNQNTTDTTGKWTVSSKVHAWVTHPDLPSTFGQALRGYIWKNGGFDPRLYQKGLTMDMLLRIENVNPVQPLTSSDNWRWLQGIVFRDGEQLILRYHKGERSLSLQAQIDQSVGSTLDVNLTSLTDGKFHRITTTFNPYGDRIARVYIDGVLAMATTALPGNQTWGSSATSERQAFTFGGGWTGYGFDDMVIDETSLLHGVFVPVFSGSTGGSTG